MHLRTKPNISSMYMYILFEDIKNFKITLIFSVCTYTCQRATGSSHYLLSPYRSEDQTQPIRLGSKHSYPLSEPSSLASKIF